MWAGNSNDNVNFTSTVATPFDDPSLMTLSQVSLQLVLFVAFALGTGLGCIITRLPNGEKEKIIKKPIHLHLSEKAVIAAAQQDQKALLTLPQQVLSGAITLFQNRTLSPKSNDQPVVDYQPPHALLSKVFSSTNPQTSLSLSTTSKKPTPEQFNHLLSLIQKYSVDTNHTYFFNQLFGRTDDVALAAEIVALSVNTSAYTYETAPVFTLLEHEVVRSTIDLVFGNGVEGDGSFTPGGSYSNMLAMHVARFLFQDRLRLLNTKNETPDKPRKRLVALVTEESHYSFKKAGKVLDIDIVPLKCSTHTGTVDMDALRTALSRSEEEGGNVFFVGMTAGSTVRGSFDPVSEVIRVVKEATKGEETITPWVHVDGAWGGSAIYSDRERSAVLDGISDADSFTFNPHKMLGCPQQTSLFVTQHKGVMQRCNSTQAAYLFSPLKNGASFDLGDAQLTCGRRTDSVKLWAILKFYGKEGLGQLVEDKVDILKYFGEELGRRSEFVLACAPWPFNVNFYYVPERMRSRIETGKDGVAVVPEDLADELSNVTVQLKLKLHEAGVMIIPYQPIGNQRADCFRLVLAGRKDFSKDDVHRVLSLMCEYGKKL